MPRFSPKNAPNVQKVILFIIGRAQEIRPWFCDFWIARWLNLIHSFFIFFNFRHLQVEKQGQSGTKCKNFGYVPFLQKFEFFQNSWNTVCVSSKNTSGASFSKIEPYSWMLHRHKNFWEFITLEPHMPWRWNLPRLHIFIRPFIWQKIWASPIGSGRVWSKNLLKKPKKIGFLGPLP